MSENNDDIIDIEFHYQKVKNEIKTNKKNTIIEAINKSIKSKSNFYELKDNDFIIIAHNKKIKESEIIESIMTQEDLLNKKIKIILIPLNQEQKEILCPECFEPCKISIKNYRINLCHESGMHNIENIKFSEFNKIQTELKNNQINSEKKYLCQKHKNLFIKYCAECDMNICDICEKEHEGHYINSFNELYINENQIKENIKKLKQNLDLFNKNLKEIIHKLNKVVENMAIFYEINENIINNYSSNYTNYIELLNIYDINNSIEKEIENIENTDYGYDINKILYLYNEMEFENSEVEINYEFLRIPTDDDIPLKIFGDKFISNNLNKCKIIFEENEYDLSHTFYSSDMPSIYSKDFSIKLKGINNITNMSSMFEGCLNIKSIYGINNIDTSKVLNMKNLFYNCKDLLRIADISKWDTKNVLNMEGLFSNDNSLISIPDISQWDTKNVISMMYLFYNCENLKTLPDISNWDLSNNIDMRYMFCNCKKLISLPDISNWNIKNVKYITSLFKDCVTLLSLPDISKWDTHSIISMNDLFQNCANLTTIPDISKWNVESLSDFSYSFMGCNSLMSLPDLTKMNIKKCKNIDGMFINCVSLSSLPDFEIWNKYKINNKHSMFKRCFNSLNFPLLES